MRGCWLLLLVLSCIELRAEEGDAWGQTRRHRLDLSISQLDTGEGDVYTFLPGYTLTLNKTIRLSVTGNYTWVRPQSSGLNAESGPGDTDFLVQYDPSRQITSSPWIPNDVGLYLGLTAPTGEAKKGLGADEWVYRLGLGWATHATGDFYLAPSIEYGSSFSGGSRASNQEYASVGVGLYWVTSWGLWAGYTPYGVRDMQAGKWIDDHRLVIGRIWPRGFGASLEYGRRDRIDKTSSRDDFTGFLNLYYQFGRLK